MNRARTLARRLATLLIAGLFAAAPTFAPAQEQQTPQDEKAADSADVKSLRFTARTDASGAAPLAEPTDKGADSNRAPTLAPTVNGNKRSTATDPWPSVSATVGSLAAVVGLFLLVAWLMRRAAPRASSVLPKEVFQVLGRAPLGPRQNAHLLRCGNRLLLVSVTPSGAETLAEIVEPEEVDRICGLCLGSDPSSTSAVFRGLLQQFAREPASRSFVDDPRSLVASLDERSRCHE
jgi:flagellar biogenesis protein FliO